MSSECLRKLPEQTGVDTGVSRLCWPRGMSHPILQRERGSLLPSSSAFSSSCSIPPLLLSDPGHPEASGWGWPFLEHGEICGHPFLVSADSVSCPDAHLLPPPDSWDYPCLGTLPAIFISCFSSLLLTWLSSPFLASQA